MLTRTRVPVASSVPSFPIDITYVTPQPIITIEEIVSKLQDSGRPIFDEKQIRILVSLQYRDTKINILRLDDQETIYNIYGMMITDPKPTFDQLVKVLENARTPKDIVWGYPQLAFARSTEILKTNLQQGTFQITEARKYCYRCKGEQNVFITYPQLRRADEPMTEIITCTSCGSRL